MKCIGDALPFQNISNEDFNDIFRYTIFELVNIFNSIDEQILDFETEIENNIGNCKYTYTHERKLLVSGLADAYVRMK